MLASRSLNSQVNST
ncbi:MAG: hypothetical protein KGM15_15300 [Pseudomonadota bacterium]|nr:hypothetical protein [Pseudomonadota bacterium]